MLRDVLEQWKYNAFTSGAENRGFYLLTLIGVPFLFIVGIALIIVKFAVPALSSTFVTICGFAFPILAVIMFILIVLMLK